MIPFRPTVERAWEAIHELRYLRIPEREYRFVVHPALKADLIVEVQRDWVLEPSAEGLLLFGLPIEEDPRVKRGWIHLRHEVVK